MIRCDVVFQGRVQGVGFRCAAREFAENLGLVGWVRNLPDGRVEMLVEGEKAVIEELIERLETSFLVQKKTMTQAPVRGDFEAFEILH